jgi:REP element-mobilizing transposase RayT/predicted RNase H-like HicB family nuclease
MARPLRLEFPGAIYHVTARGNARAAIFLGHEDRQCFMDVFGECIKRFHWLCHTYCLMDNHYHLLVETPEGNLSFEMRQLNGIYTLRFNRRHGRIGHVFQGRFKAILVERESYLLELCRYVVLNPVRAGMVANAAQYPWSSYPAPKMNTDHYTYRVTWSPEDGEYVGLCVEFPSLSWLAPAPDEAPSGIRKIVAEVVADMHANHEQVPEPLAKKHYSGELQVRVPPKYTGL